MPSPDSPDSRDFYIRGILERIEQRDGVSQRKLSSELGIALGLTNLLLRRMTAKGWVRLSRVRANRVRYLITPSGIAEKARISRAYLARTLRSYAEARQRVGSCFESLSCDWAAGQRPPDCNEQRLVFFGAGELAEVAYICLRDSTMTLDGVVDEHREKPFFGAPVYRPSQLDGTRLNGRPFWKLVVVSLDEPVVVTKALEERRVPADCVCWV